MLHCFTRCVATVSVAVATSVGFADAQPADRGLATLKSEVQSLKVERVAWREIHWKSCLLDGLKASREQKKPLMLWVFIDRPFDDERC